MIISKTAMRISFLGGSTDLKSSVDMWGGMVLGVTINKYCYISCRNLPPFFDYKTRLMYSKIETVKSNNDIEHKVIKHCVPKDMSLELSYVSDLPSCSGTGSSSSFIVGLLNSLYRLQDLSYTNYDLYYDATRVQEELKENVGYQDQAWAAFGGLNVIKFSKNNKIEIEKIYLSSEKLEFFNKTLMLFYTNISRTSSDIVGDYSLKEKEHKDLINLTNKGLEAIQNNRYLDLGNLMHASWDIKKSLSNKVTNDKIDTMFDAGMSAGARGGKLIGAGSGGCLVFSVSPEKKDEVIKALEYHGAIHIPFKFALSGSKIVLEEKDD